VGEKEYCNDPTCEQTREGIRHKYHGKEVEERPPFGIWFKREMAAYIGITICSKCGTRTKMKSTEHVKRVKLEGLDIQKGYAICPKCGHKEGWIDGGDESGFSL